MSDPDSPQHALEHAAFKQLVWALAPGDSEDYENIVQGVHAAIEEHRDLQERVSELEGLVTGIGELVHKSECPQRSSSTQSPVDPGDAFDTVELDTKR